MLSILADFRRELPREERAKARNLCDDKQDRAEDREKDI